ncbi:peptidase family M13 [Dictyocaulus viviparus]|uniref:Peptidase family M13 n=1 Tax=Dictyocaulus viviparus TaxID=29172 RepID=A0A0D8YBN7_DICVI|nr:peptidase family M13 [Dictyocaulus viviparus]
MKVTEASLLKSPMATEHRPKTHRTACAVIITILAVTLLLTFLLLYWQFSECTTQQCVLTAALVLSKMDLTIDPCVDFYNYACGQWINNSVNLNYPSWNVLYETNMKAHDKIVNAILRVINKDSNFWSLLNRGEQAAIELFNQCTDMDRLRSIGLTTWRHFVDELGGWMRELKQDVPPVPLQLSMLQAFNYSVFPLFGVGVEVNYLDSKSHIITIYEQLPLLLNPSLYQSNETVNEEVIFNKQGPQVTSLLQETGEEMAALLDFDRNSDDVRSMIAKMVELEWKITVGGNKMDLYVQQKENYEVVSVAELQIVAPILNWESFLSSLIGEPIYANETIALKAGRSWLVTMSRILLDYMKTEEKFTVLRNYIKWKTLFFHLAYVKPKCRDGYLWSVIEMYSGPPHLRKEFCILRVSGIFPLSLPSILRKIDGLNRAKEGKLLVKNISSYIIATYREMLESSQIFDNFTVSMALQKISTELFWSMVFGAGAVYREKIGRLRKPVNPRSNSANLNFIQYDFKMSLNNRFGMRFTCNSNLNRERGDTMHLVSTNADWVDSRPALSSTPIHNYERNLVQLPYDIVRSPFVDTNLLDVVNFAAIGTIIGHEITHAFDEQGKLHGPTGNLGEDWWSEEAKTKFHEREACYIEQYAQLTGSYDSPSQCIVMIFHGVIAKHVMQHSVKKLVNRNIMYKNQ